MRKHDVESTYVKNRMNRGDDRTHKDKHMMDASLRGKVGERRANQIISAIDSLKMRR